MTFEEMVVAVRGMRVELNNAQDAIKGLNARLGVAFARLDRENLPINSVIGQTQRFLRVECGACGFSCGTCNPQYLFDQIYNHKRDCVANGEPPMMVKRDV